MHCQLLAINDLLVFWEGVSEILLSPTTSEIQTWSNTTEARRFCNGLEQDRGGGRGRWRKITEEVSAFQIFLVDTKMENGRFKSFKFQMSKSDKKLINEKREN